MVLCLSYKEFKPSSESSSAAGRGASRKSDTDPELRLRSELWKHGLRYRKNVKKLPGKPDIVFKGNRVVIFCDGDFWHGKDWEKERIKLKKGSNSKYWIAKIRRNMERDLEQNLALQNDGWTVLRFWESDINNDLNSIVRLVKKKLKCKNV